MTHDEIVTTKVQTALDCGKTWAFCVERYGVSRSFVHRVSKAGYRYKPTKVKSSAKRAQRASRRRKKVHALATAELECDGRRFPAFAGAAQIRKELLRKAGGATADVPTVRTIRRDLNNVGLIYRIRKSVPTRRREDIAKRRLYKQRIEAARLDPKDIAFSDESWMTNQENTGRGQWVEKGEKPIPREHRDPRNLCRRQVWACIGHNFKSDIVIFPKDNPKTDDDDDRPKGFSLDSRGYIDRCLKTIVKKLPQGVHFMQDGARCHTSRMTMDYLKRSKMKVLEGVPAYSPDLNVIEYLWPEMNRRIGERCPTTDAELVLAIKAAWESIDQPTINRHVAHFTTALSKI